MNTKISDYINEWYANEKGDLFSVFIKKRYNYTKNNGFSSLITMQVWMFLSSFESLRIELLKSKSIINLVHIGFNSFPVGL